MQVIGRQISAHFFNNTGKSRIEWVTLEGSFTQQNVLSTISHARHNLVHQRWSVNKTWSLFSQYWQSSGGWEESISENILLGLESGILALGRSQIQGVGKGNAWTFVEGLLFVTHHLKHYTQPLHSLKTCRSLRGGTLQCSWVPWGNIGDIGYSIDYDIIQVLQW